MPVSLRKLPFCCWQCVLRTNMCLYLVARGSRQPIAATFPSLSPKEDTALDTVSMTDEHITVLTSRNHAWEKHKGQAGEHLEQPVNSCLTGVCFHGAVSRASWLPSVGEQGSPVSLAVVTDQACMSVNWSYVTRSKKLLSRVLHHWLSPRGQPKALCFAGQQPTSLLLLMWGVSLTGKASENPFQCTALVVGL